MSSARDITDRIKPPRTAFLNYPLGNSVGRPNDVQEQKRIIREALSLLAKDVKPGSTVDLGLQWPEPSWVETLVRQYEKEAEMVIRQRREAEYRLNAGTGDRVHYAAHEVDELDRFL